MPQAAKSEPPAKVSEATALSRMLWLTLMAIALIVGAGILLFVVWMIALMIDAPMSD